MRSAICVICILVVASASVAQDKKKEPVSGTQQKIPLRFFLEPKLKELEKKMKANPSREDEIIYAFLKERLEETSLVLLSASWMTDEKGMHIEDLDKPTIFGTTGLTYKSPNGKMYYFGELSAKWEDVRMLRAYKDKKDLAHAGLMFEIRVTHNDKQIAATSVRFEERFVLFDHEIIRNRVYLFDEKKKEITSVANRR